MRLDARSGMMTGMTVAPYLAELDAALVGPRRKRRDLMQEASDHLDDATDAYLRAGYDRPDAEQQAVVDFGSVDEVAPAFQTTLAVASSRRTALILLAVLALQPFAWDGPFSSHSAPPDGLLFAFLDTGVEYVGGAMIAAALLLVAATGIGNRWWQAGRGIARLTGLVVIGSAVTIKVMGVTMVLLSGGFAPGPWAMVLVFLLVPFSIAATSARRTLATC